MPTIRNKPIPVESRVTVVLMSGECYQGTRLAPDPPTGFIRLLGLEQCGGGTPWHSVMIPVCNVKYILTEIDNAPEKDQGSSSHPAGQALSPDTVIVVHNTDGTTTTHTRETDPDVYPGDTRSQGKGQGVSVHPAGQALSPDIVVEQRAEPCTHQLVEKQPGTDEWRCTTCSAVIPVPEDDAERWSRHE